ncbi:virulence factor family protein [Aureimonas sp. AU40]|uniref:virulence factor family protein n=1 Tax=Aureimonas sp. AU40 TaxID=1637747 RepID=UPI000781F9F3|nr:AcvB/VirJ family lysyl-phosphatidylglycerol hydrolase [Aureimonas sp. AU40]
MKRAPLLLAALLTPILLGGVGAGILLSRVKSNAAAAVPAAVVTYENMAGVPVFEPDSDPVGLTVLLSDEGGIAREDRELAAKLVDGGQIVVQIDLVRWRAALEEGIEDGDDCIYLGSDIEGIAKEALRALELQTYFHPVVVGRGVGGTVAYAAVADTPAATMAGGVALNAAPSARSTLPVCAGAKATPAGRGGFAYDRTADLIQPFVFIEPEGHSTDLAPTAPYKAATVVAKDPATAMDAVVAAADNISQADNSALPIIVTKPKGEPIAVALFFSGDGGWRDLDKTIGDWLSEHGVEVIGVDALRYFWSEKTPEQMATDMETMLGKANPKPGVPVALLGYSFGADTLPFAYPKLPQIWTDRIDLIGLLAPSQKTGFEISVGGWLGMSTGASDVVNALKAVPVSKLLCIYGTEDEADTACLAPQLADAAKLSIEGGHHFDGNYEALAERLLNAIKSGPAAALAAPTEAAAATPSTPAR